MNFRYEFTIQDTPAVQTLNAENRWRYENGHQLAGLDEMAKVRPM